MTDRLVLPGTKGGPAIRPGGPMPTASLLEIGGRSVVFSSDTHYFPPLDRFTREADILVHEAMLEDGVDRLVERTGNGASLKRHPMASHTLAEDAGRIATSARCRHLVLNHLIPADDPAFAERHWIEAVGKIWQGPLRVGSDGFVLDLADAHLEKTTA